MLFRSMYLGIIPILLAIFAILAGVMGLKQKNEPRMDTDRHGCGTGEDVVAVQGSAKTAEELKARNELRVDKDIPNRNAEIIFWGCVAIITLLLAFGKFFPLYALFYKLPFVNSIRNPNKFLQIFQLALGILAAYGLDALIRIRIGLPADNKAD